MHRSLFFFVIILTFLVPFGLVHADAGHTADQPHGDVLQQPHVHEDGTVDFHAPSEFTLATPWTAKWWILIGISLILMGTLSVWVEKYLRVT